MPDDIPAKRRGMDVDFFRSTDFLDILALLPVPQ